MINSAKEAKEVLNFKHEDCQDYRQMEARGGLHAIKNWKEVKDLVEAIEFYNSVNPNFNHAVLKILKNYKAAISDTEAGEK